MDGTESSSSHIRYCLTISYDGTQYAGWQWQLNANTIQLNVESAIEKVFQIPLRIHGCSRTDTGVHALGMMAHFEIPLKMDGSIPIPPQKLPLALNRFLPVDIRITHASIKPSDFHARFSAWGKQYRYFIWNHPHHNPLIRSTTWHFPQSLDIRAMRLAGRDFIGTMDFRSFANLHAYPIENTIRTVFRCSIRQSGPLLTFIIEGDGFLYKMCRGMVGTLVQIGIGKFPESAVRSMLAEKNRIAAGQTAPAHGLTLWKVFYDH